MVFFCCFKQKTAYEMRISDWSSDVCSSDLLLRRRRQHAQPRRDPRTLSRKTRSGRQDRKYEVPRPRALARAGEQLERACGRSRRGPPAASEDGYSAYAEKALDGLCRRCLRSEERRVGKECVRTCKFRWE